MIRGSKGKGMGTAAGAGGDANRGRQRRVATGWPLWLGCALSAAIHVSALLALTQWRAPRLPYVPTSIEAEFAILGIDAIPDPMLDLRAPNPDLSANPTATTTSAAPKPARRRAPTSLRATAPPPLAPAPLAAAPAYAADDAQLTPAYATAAAADLLADRQGDEEGEDDDDTETTESDPPAPAPAPPPPPKISHLSAGIAQSLRVYDPFPSMPEALRATGIAQAVQVEICVANHGGVSDVTMDRQAAPSLQDVLRSTIRTWRYRPLIVQGAAMPFCHEMQIRYMAN